MSDKYYELMRRGQMSPADYLKTLQAGNGRVRTLDECWDLACATRPCQFCEETALDNRGDCLRCGAPKKLTPAL